jgi:hypothetical protein
MDFYSPPTGTIGQPSPGMGAPQPPQPVQNPGAFGGQPVQQPFQPPGGQMGSAPTGGAQPGIFNPGASPAPTSADDDFENEPPLLEELGINVEHIIARIKGVAFFKKVDQDVLVDLDLSGPLAIIMALACCLLLAGKISFSYLYGLGFSGSTGIWMLVNVMNQKGGIDLYRTSSILGYGLIPVVVLAFFGIFVSLQSAFGAIVAGVCIFWATATSSRFFATAIAMQQQRWLVAYPVGLFYTCFTLLAVF